MTWQRSRYTERWCEQDVCMMVMQCCITSNPPADCQALPAVGRHLRCCRPLSHEKQLQAACMRAAGSAQAGAGPYASNVQQQQQVEGVP